MAKAAQPRRIGIDLGENSLAALILRPDGRLSASLTPLAAFADQTALAAALRALPLPGDPSGDSPVEVVVTSSRPWRVLQAPPRIALLITEGFEDLLEVNDAPCPELESLLGRRLRELCPRERVLGVPERLGADGGVVRALTSEALSELRQRVAALNVQAIAVVLLHSYQSDAHERTIAEALGPLKLPIALSSSLLRVPDERLRAGVALLDACLAAAHHDEPALLRRQEAWRVLHSDASGDVSPTPQVAPLRQLFAAVAAGLRGAQRIAAAHGKARFLALQQLDSCAVVALHDPSLLEAAPASRGFEPWAEVPAQELRIVATPPGLEGDALIAALAEALEAITVDRGHDPAAYPLLGYGRVTPTVAKAVGDRLGPASLLLLPAPLFVAAYGALCAPLVVCRRELLAVEASSAQQTGQIAATLHALTHRLRDELGQKGYLTHATSTYLPGLEWQAELRYHGQEGHTLLLAGLGDGGPAVSGDTDLVVRFCAEHQRRYGFVLSECPVEIVALRVRVTLPVSTPSYSEFMRMSSQSLAG